MNQVAGSSLRALLVYVLFTATVFDTSPTPILPASQSPPFHAYRSALEHPPPPPPHGWPYTPSIKLKKAASLNRSYLLTKLTARQSVESNLPDVSRLIFESYQLLCLALPFGGPNWWDFPNEVCLFLTQFEIGNVWQPNIVRINWLPAKTLKMLILSLVF